MRTVADILAGFEALPLAALDALLQGRRPIILAPHPDDESLGCGGLIAAACEAGLTPEVVILTDGAASHPGSVSHPPPRLRRFREGEALHALHILGLGPEHVTFLGFSDAAMPMAGPEFDAGVARLTALAARRTCGLVVGPWHGDPHRDHEAGAAMAAAVAQAAALPLLSYPVWGWLRDGRDVLDEPRRGGFRLDVSGWLAPKQAAIAAHETQSGGVIADSPDGFRLPPGLLAIFARPFEVFIAP